VLARDKRRELLEDREAVLARTAGQKEDAFEVASSWMAPDVAAAVGLTPREDDGGRQLLRQMCVRCHSSNAPAGSKRAQFNAERLETIEPSTARAVLSRLKLPRTSSKLMPPRRACVLTSEAIEHIQGYIERHCSDPRPGACE
jgi:hypothetical protein